MDSLVPRGLDPVDPVALARSLIDIDSTTGREAEAGAWLARFLRDRGYRVVEQPIAAGRFNVFAQQDEAPRVVLSTHFDCVPPFFPSRQERGLLFGRGSCDAKGILAAQVAAAERLRAGGKSKKAAGGAVARKMAGIVFAILTSGKPWSEEIAAKGLAKADAMLLAKAA